MSEPVTITSGALTARIDPLGAELLSLIDAAGSEWMTDANPEFWGGHAPLLFPIVGGLAGDCLRHQGREYHLPRHGFARRSPFALVEQAEDRAVFRLADTAATRETYPFAFGLEVAFALTGHQLAMIATVANPGDETLPFSFGFHPAFAWPLPGGGAKAGHAICFAGDEPQPVRRLDAAGLLAGSEATPVVGGSLPLSPELFADDALIWDRLASRRVEYRSPAGPWLDIGFNLPMLGIWQVPGGNYICIEPWAGHADPAGFTGEFAEKPGIVLLAPGASHSFRMDVTVHHG